MANIPLKITNLQKSFLNNKVLDGINLNIKKNEIFGLIGLNGAGKTTIIKIILNLINSDNGSVKISEVPSERTESRKNLKYLPEKFQVSSMLKGIEFLKLFYNFKKNTKIQKEELENKILELCNLLAFDFANLSLKVSKYSKGMMQKLGLISTFLDDSEMIILDEPMSGLDPKARIYLKNLLLKSKKDGKSIFFSSHVLSDIDEICDRIGVLSHGKIVFTGTPIELKTKYNETSLEKAFLREIEN